MGMNSDRLRALLPHLPLLTALAEEEHLTRAAEEIGMPQPAASRALKSLSRRLGGQLTTPAGRGIQLSPSARALVPFARIALRSLEDGLEAWDTALERASSTVGVSFQNSHGERVIPALIREVHEGNPEIRFNLHQGPRQHCLDLIADGRVDIAVVSDFLPSGTEFVAFPLFTQPLVALIPAGNGLAARADLRVVDLVDEPFVTLKQGFGVRRSVDALFAASGLEPTLAFEGEDLRTVAGLVAAGLGVSIVPRDGHTPDGCVWVPLADTSAERHMVAVVRTASASAAVAIVTDALSAVAHRHSAEG